MCNNILFLISIKLKLACSEVPWGLLNTCALLGTLGRKYGMGKLCLCKKDISTSRRINSNLCADV